MNFLNKLGQMLLALVKNPLCWILLFGLFYVGKYRPARNAKIAIVAENKLLKVALSESKERQDSLVAFVQKSSLVPRYKIEQLIKDTKVKDQSALHFLPEASMQLDSIIQALPCDSLRLPEAVYIYETRKERRERLRQSIENK